MSAPESIVDRPTPLLRWGSALLKLEMWRTSRAFDYGGPGVIEATGNAAIAAAQWARARGVEIAVKPRGVFTHEMRETLKLWGVRVDAQLQPTLQPPDAAGIFAKTLA